MKKILSSLILIGVLYQTSVYGQTSALDEETINHANILGQKAINSNLGYEVVRSLTTEVGHRMVGTANDAKGVEWAVNKMKEYGFDRVWTEPVTVPRWHRGPVTTASITAPFSHNMAVTALGNSIATPEEGITAEIVQFDEYKDLVAAPANSLNGKIAYISFRMEENGLKGYGYAGQARRNGSVAAAKAGASAIIIRSIGTDDNRTPHTGSMNYQEGVEKIPAAAISNPDADLLDNVLSYGQPVMVSLKLTSHMHDPIVTYNVLGEITGTDEPEKAVMLGAHLDSWDQATGALDDGVGVGIMLAAGKHIIDSGKKPKRSIRVLLFAAEEIGLLGAAEYVRAHQEDHKDFDNHILGAEWDSGTGNILSLTPGVGPTSLSAVREMGKVLGPYGVAINPENDAKGQSDMSRLGEAGMPAVNLNADDGYYMDYHHTPNDTLDKVDAEAMKQATAVYTMFAWMAAQMNVDYRK